MSELPPPPPPGGTGSASGSQSWDWDRARELALHWFRPLADRDGWMALAYLFGSAVASGVVFVAMVAVGALTFGLLFVIVGFLLVVPFFTMVTHLASLERWFAALAGHEIEPRPVRPVSGIGPRAMAAAVTDPVRWRQVVFLAANVLVAPLLLAIGSFPVWLSLQLVFGASVLDRSFFGLGWLAFGGLGTVGLVAGVLAAGLIPRVAIWTADVKAELDAWFLGADRLAAAEERVSTLSAQRQDILDAVAAERRRIERNLHDGVQQQLVAIGLDLGMAARHVDDDPIRARQLIDSAREKVQGSIGELRQLGRGLHPAILEDRGLDAALSAVVSSAPIPISVHVDPDLDLPTDVAETLYFVANEAVANVLKHARARSASVRVTKVAANARLTVHDDGRGGADPSRGTGLAGIRARVNAVDGVFAVTSPAGGPTTVMVEVPRNG